MIAGVIGGVLGALFNQINKMITIWRKRLIVPYSFRNVMEVVLVTAVVASVSFIVPYKNDQVCTSKTHFQNPHAPLDLLPAAEFYCSVDENGVEMLNGRPNHYQICSTFALFYSTFTRCCSILLRFPPAVAFVLIPYEHFSEKRLLAFTCISDRFIVCCAADYALLFFQPSEQSIKMLFHSEENLTKASLVWFTVIYFFLACWTYGISVPSYAHTLSPYIAISGESLTDWFRFQRAVRAVAVNRRGSGAALR